MDNNNPYTDAFGVKYPEGDISLERVPYTHISSPLDHQHTVLSGETIFSIAFKYYGDSGLWGRIADLNSIYDVCTEVTPGTILTIPHGRS